MPQIGDRIIATAAADAKVQIHTVETQETSQVYKCHIGRVKRLATAPDTPYMLWSASEDGTIRLAQTGHIHQSSLYTILSILGMICGGGVAWL